MIKLKEPFCPYCYDGKIVKDGYGTMFCDTCYKAVKVKLWDGTNDRNRKQ